MTNSNDMTIERALRTFEAAVEHAVRYKELFHSMQDKYLAAEDRCVAKQRIIERQRQIIAKLESQLGVDQEL
jgi:hypothetical protein